MNFMHLIKFSKTSISSCQYAAFSQAASKQRPAMPVLENVCILQSVPTGCLQPSTVLLHVPRHSRVLNLKNGPLTWPKQPNGYHRRDLGDSLVYNLWLVK